MHPLSADLAQPRCAEWVRDAHTEAAAYDYMMERFLLLNLDLLEHIPVVPQVSVPAWNMRDVMYLWKMGEMPVIHAFNLILKSFDSYCTQPSVRPLMHMIDEHNELFKESFQHDWYKGPPIDTPPFHMYSHWTRGTSAVSMP